MLFRSFSRKSTGEHREVDINATLRAALALFSEQLRSHKIAVSLDLDRTLPHIWGDPIQLTQVFVNLITNGRDALDEAGGGQITIHSRLGRAGHVEVSFADTGPGIDATTLPRIFDPFFTTKPVGSGTGLGLSIAIGLVQAHGGQLTASSEPGRGARFTVSLPAGEGKYDDAGTDPGRR